MEVCRKSVLFIGLLISFLVAGKVVSSRRWVVPLFPSMRSNPCLRTFPLENETFFAEFFRRQELLVNSKNSFSLIWMLPLIYYTFSLSLSRKEEKNSETSVSFCCFHKDDRGISSISSSRSEILTVCQESNAFFRCASRFYPPPEIRDVG